MRRSVGRRLQVGAVRYPRIALAVGVVVGSTVAGLIQGLYQQSFWLGLFNGVVFGCIFGTVFGYAARPFQCYRQENNISAEDWAEIVRLTRQGAAITDTRLAPHVVWLAKRHEYNITRKRQRVAVRIAAWGMAVGGLSLAVLGFFEADNMLALLGLALLPFALAMPLAQRMSMRSLSKFRRAREHAQELIEVDD